MQRLIPITIVLVSFGVAFAAEIAARALYADSNLGWFHEKPLDERVADCLDGNDSDDRVLVFGDSFVEYFRDTSNNMVTRADSRRPGLSFCNFAFSGANLDQYLWVWRAIVDRVPAKGAIFAIYTGNDADSYYFEALRLATSTRDREAERPTLMAPATLEPFAVPGALSLLKRSVFLNALYRFVIKPHVLRQTTTPDQFMAEHGEQVRMFGLSRDTVDQRLARVPEALRRKAGSDVVNRHLLKRAILEPRLYHRIQEGYGRHGDFVFANVADRIDGILRLCRRANVPCGFVLIEPDAFQTTAMHPFWRDLGFDLDGIRQGRSGTAARFLDIIRAGGAPAVESADALRGRPEAFIPEDIHLSVAGHRILSDVLLDLGERLTRE